MSYIRNVRFTLAPTARSRAQAIADDLVTAIKEQPGCDGAFFGADDEGECALVVLWQSRQQADAAATVISPRLNRHLSGNVVGQPDIHLLPVLAH